jgi:hypothetical protein
MYQLSNEQVNLIDQDLIRLGLTTESVRANILDHLCILIEQEITHPDEFDQAYSAFLPVFYHKELREIEKQTQQLLLSHDHVILTKVQFFLLLFFMLAGPFVIYLLCSIPAQSPASPYMLPKTLWGPVLAYALWPLCSLLVMFLIPDHLDPPIPKHARIALGFRPVIFIIEQS